MANTDMLSLEEARELVTSKMRLMAIESVPVLDAVGRVCATAVKSDMDVSPFAHSAMDGFALRAAELEAAIEEAPVGLKVVGAIGAGDVFEGTIGEGECVRIMTGACLPDDADAVVKYEVVDYQGTDGGPGSTVVFAEPTKVGSNVRPAGEEAKAGEVIVQPGEIITCAGVGFLASCGALHIDTYKRPRVAVMATGSELVPPSEVPGPGHIRESNAYAIAACIKAAGCEPVMLPIVPDEYDVLAKAVKDAAEVVFPIFFLRLFFLRVIFAAAAAHGI